MTNEQNEFLDRCASAFSVFQARFPDYENYNSEATARRMAAELNEAGLSADSADALGVIWSKIRPAAPATVVTETEADSLTLAARALISSVGGDAAFSQLVNDLSAKELERRMRDYSFQRAIELVTPTEAPSTLTRGDLVHGANIVRTAERTGGDIAEAHAAVAASRELVSSAYANYVPPTATQTADPHFYNPMARKPASARRQAYTPAELKQFERENAARNTEPKQSRADAVREAQEAEAAAKLARWNHK
jgi:hypothetical protein